MAGEERDLTNRDDSRPVRVKVDNVKKIYNTRNGEMVALNGVTLQWKRSKRNRYRPWRCIPAVCIIPMAYC